MNTILLKMMICLSELNNGRKNMEFPSEVRQYCRTFFLKGIVSYERKRFVVLLLTILCLTACGGGSDSKTGSNVLSVSDGVEWRDKDICAVVFVGFGKDFASISNTGDYAKFCERFPSLRKMVKFVAETEGDEIYYIIPRFSDATVTINEYKTDIEDNMKEITGKKIYDGASTPLLIRCNQSDLHPNTTITVTGNGKSITFNPVSSFGVRDDLQFISSENGFDSDSESTDDVVRSGFATEYSYKGISAGIHAKLNNGNVLITYDREEATSILGETEFEINDNYTVESTNNGSYNGVFIGDVGQDYNPVLCCQLKDGGIEVLELYEALRSFDFRTSGRLPGHDDVVSVTNEGVQYSEEGGGYVTLFTFDASGNKKEVEFNALLNGTWIHQTKIDDYDVRFIVYLSPDWKITYVCGYVDSDVFDGYLGTCRIIEENETTVVYEYEMKESDRSEMTGEAPDPTLKTGTFKAVRISDDWFDGIKITCLTGLMFHPGDLGEGATFINKYRMEKNAGVD